MKKYIVIGEMVESKNDGEYHYINARKLCDLYRINPEECYLIETCSKVWELRLKGLPDLPRLLPRHDGNYNLS